MLIECRNNFLFRIVLGAICRGWQRKRYKDTLKQTLKLTGINTETWHELAENRIAWRQAVKKLVQSFEAEVRKGVRSFGRLETRADNRQKRKAKEALDLKVQQNPASADFVCQICGGACKSRTHSQQH